MTRLGLTLNEAKTSLKNARQERFDFLGYAPTTLALTAFHSRIGTTEMHLSFSVT
jgi:hypothetical protein